jgi:parallel beta-helix repeat protein
MKEIPNPIDAGQSCPSPFTRMKFFQFKSRLVPAIWLVCFLLLCAASGAWAATNYVNINNRTPSAPYTNWSTAATNIQIAVDAASPGNVILVADGVYQTGGRFVNGAISILAISNRVAVTKPLTLLSVNGPGRTVILGRQVPETFYDSGANGNGATRCVYLTNGAVLSGFTLINGATQTSFGDALLSSGGGVWCQSSNVVVTNCVIMGNTAYYSGGGAYSGTLNNCILSGNSVSGSSYILGGGAVASSILNNCMLSGNSAPRANGGGASFSTLNNCTLSGNSAVDGGGADSSTLNNCILSDNSASFGGGAHYGTLNNCTLSGNSAIGDGGGVYSGTLNNCIVYYNNSSLYPGEENFYSSELNHCCTTPLPASGVGNFTNAPLFVNQAGGDFHLQASSPCINSGMNSSAQGTTDLDGNPRIRGGAVDVGAYEFQNPTSIVSYLWLQQYGLPVDGSADVADTDNDGTNNWQEWRAGTDPTDAASVLKLAKPTFTAGQVTLTWTSITNHRYFIQRATDLGAVTPFSLLQTNVPGLTGTTSYTDTNAPVPAYYRIGVQ